MYLVFTQSILGITLYLLVVINRNDTNVQVIALNGIHTSKTRLETAGYDKVGNIVNLPKRSTGPICFISYVDNCRMVMS